MRRVEENSAGAHVIRGEMLRVTGLGSDWETVWRGDYAADCTPHLCRMARVPEGQDPWQQLPFRPTGTPGIEVAACERCRVAWVRRRA